MGIVDNLVDSPAEWSAVGFVCKGATPKEEVSPKTNMASDTLAIWTKWLLNPNKVMFSINDKFWSTDHHGNKWFS